MSFISQEKLLAACKINRMEEVLACRLSHDNWHDGPARPDDSTEVVIMKER